MGRMRVRIALGLAFLATAIGLAIDMSGSAQRLAGDNKVRWPPPAFSDVVPGGGTACIGDTALPSDAGRIAMTIGTYGQRMPRIAIEFDTAAGKRVASAVLRGGGTQAPGGVSYLPLSHPHGPSALGKLCLHVRGRHKIALGGDFFGLAAAFTTIDGAAQSGRPAILFYRPGHESWWSLLGALDLRFGLGKSPIFGDWTLPVIALALLALWFAVGRLLWRELR